MADLVVSALLLSFDPGMLLIMCMSTLGHTWWMSIMSWSGFISLVNNYDPWITIITIIIVIVTSIETKCDLRIHIISNYSFCVCVYMYIYLYIYIPKRINLDTLKKFKYIWYGINGRLNIDILNIQMIWSVKWTDKGFNS